MSFLSPEFFLQAFLAAFGAGGVSVFVGAWRDKHKADAEASKEDATAADIIEGAAGRQVIRFEKEISDLKAELGAERILSKESRELNIKVMANLREREAWEREVVAVLHANGQDVRPPPRLEL